MKKPSLFSSSGEKNQLAFQGGSYSLMLSAIVLALLIVVNILVSVLPTNFTKYDISSAKLYSITSNTKAVVNALQEDVTIYWIVQSDKEDEIIQNLLSKYESLSDHISVVKKNPDVYPTFAQQYTDEDVPNNSLVVECGDRSRYIGYDDIYLTETNMYSYSYSYNISFDGEGAITSAIDYVVNGELPQIYVLEGHGEAELPSIFSEQLERENMEVTSFSLLNVDAIPEEADCILIYSPASDISQEEADMLEEYLSQGGRLMVLAGPVEDGTLENLYSLLSDYGITPVDGIVVEGDREHYAFQAPFVLMPDMAESDLTSSLIEERYYPILPLAQGLDITSASSQVTALLTTSESAFSKTAGYDMDTYEKEDGDIDGPFAVGLSVSCTGGGEIIWFSSSAFLEDMYNAYSSGANVNLTTNALSSLVGESEAMAIRSKSLNYNYLTISESTSSLLKVTMIGVFPLLYLGIGIYVVLRRRRMQHEAV